MTNSNYLLVNQNAQVLPMFLWLTNKQFVLEFVSIMKIVVFWFKSKIWPQDPINNVDTIIGLDNGFTLNRWQAITWTNDGLEKKNYEIAFLFQCSPHAGIILCMHPVNEGRRYKCSAVLIGWASTQNDPCRPIQQRHNSTSDTVELLLSSTAMTTSSNGNIFRVTGHLCGEFTGPRWIPRTKASDAELWCFLWSTSE